MDVRVFERSTVPLSDRGAGLGVPTATCITLRDQGYIDDSLPHLSVRSLAHSSRPRAGSGHDGIAGQVPTWLEAIRWGHLYERLRSRVPSERYVQGREVITATQSTERVVLTFDDGNHEQFDVVVFADGYRSIGRALVSPNRQPQYQGYFLWRGMVPETQIDVERFDQTLQRVGYPGGHLFAYLLPGADGSTAVGHRELNWGMFLSRSSDALGELLVDKHGGQQDLSVPPGHLRDDIEHHLKAQAKTLLPERFARLVQASEATFGQGIVATQPDRYHLGRLCLAGDAGAVVPPFTTSGVFKGMTNAIELVASLRGRRRPDACARRLGPRATASGRWSEGAVRPHGRPLDHQRPRFF